MWTRNVPISAALRGLLTAALISPGVVFAQGPDAAPAAPGNLLQQVKWLRLEIVGGRIVARSDRCNQSRLATESSASGESRQTLNLETQASTLVVRYEQVDAGGRLLLEFNERGQFSITRSGGAKLPEICYLQPVSGKVKLTVSGQPPRTIAADNLWQLLISERELCTRHLLPLLSTLRPNWRLPEQLEQTQTALFEQAGTDVLAQRRQWKNWIDDLAGADFPRRQAADVALRKLGQPVLAYLRGLDESQLEGEQRRRIRSILNDLPDGSPDSPARVADWLAGDKRVWLALLARGELDERIAAAEHLSKLCRRPLPFDPMGSAEVRSAQVAELTAKLAGN